MQIPHPGIRRYSILTEGKTLLDFHFAVYTALMIKIGLPAALDRPSGIRHPDMARDMQAPAPTEESIMKKLDAKTLATISGGTLWCAPACPPPPACPPAKPSCGSTKSKKC